ncbi:hypothetical protein [Parasporobacterium paucivorans]|uniref:Uncharacterized protein n=1 Tax=Parasporobacterium paucivorans DSM 15970 TaxID=1122934 RepID=A0A1M6IS12_9FIRM|nr:hypothetical protein [Parasporobacterium paucivorans]SHJ37242.1 hypothetical protein SAMN02745691_01837 [Parasporobacterium paucivorans DSM 15970]
MNISWISIFATLKPAILLAALIPFLIALFMWILFYQRYDAATLGRIRNSFKKLADDGEKIKDCKRENISFMDEMVIRMAPPYFLEAWLRMRTQIEKNYKGDFIPEGQSFYDFEAMVSGPGCRSRLDSIWKSFWVLAIITLAAPIGMAALFQQEALLGARVLGGSLFVLLCLGNLVFTLLDQRMYFSVRTEYHRFIGIFNRVIPVAKAEVAMLLEATQRNQEAYQAATQEIVRKFDTMVDNTLLPALEDSIEMIMRSNLVPALHNIERTLDSNMSRTLEIQEKGMEQMTTDFADRLGETVVEKMSGLADTIGNVQNSMEVLNQNMMDHVRSMTEAMDSTLDLQEKSMERISSMFAETFTGTLDTQMSSLIMSISDVRRPLEELNLSLGNHVMQLQETTRTSMELQREQTSRSISLQDERITQMVDAQDQRITQMMDQQVQQMAALTVSFTEALTDTLHENITGLNQQIGGLQTQMDVLNQKLSSNIDELGNMLHQQHEVLEESAKMLMSSGENQERTIAETREIQRRAVENSEQLGQHVQRMADTIVQLTQQTQTFSQDAFKFTRDTNEAQVRVLEDVKLSQDKLEAAVNETMSQYARMNDMISGMMDNITQRMNEAMTNAGREIAHGIKEVTADNAEAISNLTEQAQNLRNDYETYFSRLEDSTYKTLEDMDYQIRGIIGRITEDIGAMMKENTEANADILGRYKDNTTDLLQSFDEQARSIGLYAKEINMDITDLSNNLQASVGEFSSKMQEGVRMTLGEFDSGLSELTQRIANTVESISDAVEALPDALGRK